MKVWNSEAKENDSEVKVWNSEVKENDSEVKVWNSEVKENDSEVKVWNSEAKEQDNEALAPNSKMGSGAGDRQKESSRTQLRKEGFEAQNKSLVVRQRRLSN